MRVADCALVDFRWNPWNIEHVGRHSVDPDEAEEVVESARSPFPRRIGDEKWIVWGRTEAGRQLQVVFVLDEDGTAFVIHARELTEVEKRRERRLRK
jgi:uncharacterized DUF497 family protein